MNDEIAARRENDREMPVVCNVVARDALHGRRMTKWLASRLEASTFLQSRGYNDDERFFMAIDCYRR